MSVPADLQQRMTALAGAARTDRIADWSGSVEIVVGGVAWVICLVDGSGVRLAGPDTDAATTLRVTSAGALRSWLVDGVDFTHLVASGDFAIDGVYFDVLLLSKALGLRPDRNRSASR
jgi:hypothetical protein